MRNKTLTIAIATALLSSGAALAQVKGPGTGTDPSGAPNSEGLGMELPGVTCSSVGTLDCGGDINNTIAPTQSQMRLAACGGAITDINVGLDIAHTWVGDMSITITSPDDTTVTIYDRPGVPASTFGCSGNDVFAALDDEAGSPVEDECADATPTISGGFIPNNALSAFDGLSANGVWTVEVTDNAGGDNGFLNDWSLEIEPAGCVGGGLDAEPIARFQVLKDFDDDNPAEVDVEITCNTGLPLMQPGTISEGDGVTFVVTDFNEGDLDCEITETGVDGYTAEYDSGFGVSDVSCVYESVAYDTFQTCTITNSLDPVDVEVTKWWMDENPQFDAINFAEATYNCVNEQFGTNVFGSLEFLGDGAVDGFSVYPDWDGTTTCTVSETVVEGGIEFDDSECLNLSVTPGMGASCNIYNTRLYEGIPTLSHYGLALMALLASR